MEASIYYFLILIGLVGISITLIGAGLWKVVEILIEKKHGRLAQLGDKENEYSSRASRSMIALLTLILRTPK